MCAPPAHIAVRSTLSSYRWAAGASLIALAATAACAPPTSGLTQSTPLPRAVQVVSVTLRGELDGSAMYNSVMPNTTCAQLVSSGASSSNEPPEGVPPAPDDTQVDGHPFSAVIAPSPYRGPGIYSSTAFTSENIVMVDSTVWAPLAAGSPPSTTTARFDADGSGSVSFSAWRDASDGDLEGGTITWSCND
ncbi:MAG: hypothetical protein JOY80_11415 [Candidatus Dormibacteraeota bacterium]|nr:hypothetical protein [Candidatus Dormibacteraeota bacterium]